MSLVPITDRQLKKTWSERDRKSVRHKLPQQADVPAIAYSNLKDLCDLVDNADSTESRHEEFMTRYKSMFVKPPATAVYRGSTGGESKAKKASLNSLSSKSVGGTSSLKADTEEPSVYSVSHDIRDHLRSLHKERKSENPHALRAERIKTLRRLCKKLPFERNASDNEQIFEAVRHFPDISSQMEPDVLKELCVVAQLDWWKEADTTVFGNTGLHLVLKGKVKPQSWPYLLSQGDEYEFRSPTPEPDVDLETLKVGECFGTLEKVEGRGPNSRILTAVTMEMNCEFLKISATDYTRVVQQLNSRTELEKVNLLQSCETFKLWSRQPLAKVAMLLEWIHFPANTVLASEGYKSPFLGIVKNGECHVLRQVQVLRPLPNGKQEKKLKQVVMGKLSQSQSFGELSVILQEPMTCSVVTSTAVDLGCIDYAKLMGLDETTLQLLKHSCQPTYGSLTQENIHDEYVSQELKKEWNEFKHGVVVDVINAKGIRPGYGKWTK